MFFMDEDVDVAIEAKDEFLPLRTLLQANFSRGLVILSEATDLSSDSAREVPYFARNDNAKITWASLARVNARD
jgi:hypothetical protein